MPCIKYLWYNECNAAYAQLDSRLSAELIGRSLALVARNNDRRARCPVCQAACVLLVKG